MKAEFHIDTLQLVDALSQKLIKEILTILKSKIEDNTIFGVHDLAEYLGVDVSWVYKQVSMKKIPFFKCGKYIKFKKSKIDNWIDKRTNSPIYSIKRSKYE